MELQSCGVTDLYHLVCRHTLYVDSYDGCSSVDMFVAGSWLIA